jgi:hypothetical protein
LQRLAAEAGREEGGARRRVEFYGGKIKIFIAKNPKYLFKILIFEGRYDKIKYINVNGRRISLFLVVCARSQSMK